MKKVLMIILIVLCLAGVGVLGYVVFRSRNIESVAIEGQMQTLYFVDEATTPNFDGAKLVVTYKNGNIKKLDITSKNVKIDDFSTSIKSHGKMKITYKSQTITKEYDVVESGLYYRSKEVTTSSDKQPVTSTISFNNTRDMVYFEGNGAVTYYAQDVNGLWFMYETEHHSNYNYKIVGDTLVLNLADRTYNIKANYDSTGEDIYLTSTEELPGVSHSSGSKTTTFTCVTKKASYKPEVKVDEIQPSNADGSALPEGGYVFHQGTSFDKCNIVIHVIFKETVVYKENTTEQFIKDVYIKVTEDMVSGLHLEYAMEAGHAEIHYQDKTKSFQYKVEE